MTGHFWCWQLSVLVVQQVSCLFDLAFTGSFLHFSFKTCLIGRKVTCSNLFSSSIAILYPAHLKSKAEQGLHFHKPSIPRLCFYHVTYELQNESALHSCLNVKEPLAKNRRRIWSLSDSNGIWTYYHLVRNLTLNHLGKLTQFG